MAILKLIDTKEKFLLEIDGKDIPYVSTYQITKTVMGHLHVDIHLSVNDVEEMSIETDQAANVAEKAEDIKFSVKRSKR